jgi:hypothetical protein
MVDYRRYDGNRCDGNTHDQAGSNFVHKCQPGIALRCSDQTANHYRQGSSAKFFSVDDVTTI